MAEIGRDYGASVVRESSTDGNSGKDNQRALTFRARWSGITIIGFASVVLASCSETSTSTKNFRASATSVASVNAPVPTSIGTQAASEVDQASYVETKPKQSAKADPVKRRAPASAGVAKRPESRTAALQSSAQRTALVRTGVALQKTRPSAPSRSSKPPKSEAKPVKYRSPAQLTKTTLPNKRPVRFVTGFEVSQLATWPSPDKSPGQMQRFNKNAFMSVVSGGKRGVPVYVIRGSLLQVPTQTNGMRWIKKIDVNLSPIDCKAKSVRVGGAGRGAVAAGAGGSSIVCGT